jgi:hypothetical protein
MSKLGCGVFKLVTGNQVDSDSEAYQRSTATFPNKNCKAPQSTGIADEQTMSYVQPGKISNRRGHFGESHFRVAPGTGGSSATTAAAAAATATGAATAAITATAAATSAATAAEAAEAEATPAASPIAARAAAAGATAAATSKAVAAIGAPP